MTRSTAITVDYQEPSIRSLTINASYGGAQRHRRLIAATIILGGQVVGTGLPTTSGKRGFYPPPLVPKLFGPGLKVALVPVRAAGVRPAPSPGS
jgi:hypothetical protein